MAASLVDVPHAGPVHRVVLVGEGDFTECILEQALLTNVFDVPGGVRYDVLGSLHEWQMMHLGLAVALETNNDELYFHMGAWYEHRDLLYNADRIILCGDVSDNIRIANELQQEPIRALHVRADGESGLRIMGRSQPGSAGPEHVEVFGTKQQICTFGIILQDYVHERGKLRDIIYGLGTPRCNACPCFDFSGIPNVPRDWDITDEDREAIRDARLERMHDQGTDAISKCLTCPNFSNEWTAYDGFTRRSNYAVAAHDGQKFRLLRLLGIPVSHAMSVQEEIEGYQNLPRRTRDALQEIEHIRWCRFHFLNGWTYASGKKNKRMRTHPDLLPYWSLQTDRSKDADAYLNLCLMIRSPEEEQEFDRIWLGK
ncbi:MAG: hypothetical protein Q4C09_02625 [Atopobiaceae bacterium]|nr:hypothetical protein [Atopobiaceae bacterium]